MNKMIMRDSDEAAKYVTGLKGWVSRTGVFYGDKVESESMARYDGCTHDKCRDCGKPTVKHYLICDECRSRKDFEKYNAMPEKQWDGVAMVYSEANNSFYLSPEDAEDSLDEGQSIEDLQLVICEPVYARRLDEDYFCDDIPEDGELSDVITAAIDTFNKATEGIIVSWKPGKYKLAEPTTGAEGGDETT